MASLLPGDDPMFPQQPMATGLLSNMPLQIGLGILANNRGNYGNFGAAVGQGAMQGFQNVQNQMQLQQMAKIRNAQLKQIENQEQEAKRKMESGERFKQQFPDYAGLYDINPEAAATRAYPMQKEKEPIKLGAGDILLDPVTGQPIYTAPPKPESMPSAVQEYEYAKQQGYKGSLLDYQLAQKKAGASVNNLSVGFPKEQFKNERDLRNDFAGLPTTKAFKEVQNSYDQISTALKNPSAANDLAAATKFMKLLDPGSVVRESELALAMEATGKVDRMKNYLNYLNTGQKLTPQQRQDFSESARQLYEAAANRYNETATEFRTMAKDYELNPERIAKPVAVPKTIEQTKQSTPAKSKKFDIDGKKLIGTLEADGNYYVRQNGKKYRVEE